MQHARVASSFSIIGRISLRLNAVFYVDYFCQLDLNVARRVSRLSVWFYGMKIHYALGEVLSLSNARFTAY